MPLNGSGVYTPPGANYPAVSLTLITAANRNAVDADISTALSTALYKDGQSTPTANIPLGGFKLTGLAVGTLVDDAARVSQVQNSTATYLTAVSGTNTIIGTAAPVPAAYVSGQAFQFIPAATNTGATTINVSSLGAKNIFSGGAACVGGEIVISVPCGLVYDGTQFNIIGPYVGGLIPTGQIKFPATQNASSNANTLDDYEEGTWTPVLSFVTPGNLSVVYSTQVGWYIKIGQLATISANVQTSTFTHTTASGNGEITGLPFAATSTSGHAGMQALQFSGITKANYTSISGDIVAGTSTIGFGASGSGQGAANVTASDMPTGGTVIIKLTGNYRTTT